MAANKKTPDIKWPETVSQIQFADIVGLSKKHVVMLASQNVLVSKGGKLLFRESLQGYLHHMRKSAQGRRGESGFDLTDERAQLARTQREREQLLLARLRGDVMDRNEAAQGWGHICGVVKSSVLALPSKIRQAIPHVTAHDAQIIDRVCRDVLEMASEEIVGANIAGATGPSDLSVIEPVVQRRTRKTSSAATL